MISLISSKEIDHLKRSKDENQHSQILILLSHNGFCNKDPGSIFDVWSQTSFKFHQSFIPPALTPSLGKFKKG